MTPIGNGRHQFSGKPFMVTNGTEASNDALPEGLWKTEHVCRYLKVSERTVMRRIAESGLPCIRMEGTLRFRRADIDAWLDEQAEKAHAPDDGGGSREQGVA